MTLPNLLLIGAAKSGTSTLAHDLSLSPEIHLPACKEPHGLTELDISRDSERRRYGSIFSQGKTKRYRLDASTGYSKLPDAPNTARTAAKHLPSDTKIIYAVRDPFQRAFSHYRHIHRQLPKRTSFQDALTEHPEIVSISKYNLQISPWTESFDHDSIKVVVFESYISNRKKTLQTLADWLQTSVDLTAISQNEGKNRNIGSRHFRFGTQAIASRIQASFTYKYIQDTAPIRAARTLARGVLLTQAKSSIPQPTDEDRQHFMRFVNHDFLDFTTRFSIPTQTDAEGSTKTPAQPNSNYSCFDRHTESVWSIQ
ncbi:sulfotransferase domain-containing protein [Rhodopirellula baltica]